MINKELIQFKKNPDKQEDVKDLLNPAVNKWFFTKFKEFSLPQLYGVMEVHSRQNTLISAPTGSGKTLTSFLSILNELVGLSEKNLLENKTYCIYISPLKALNNDIFKNLIEPLEEIEKLSEKKYNIRIAVRTGDTTQKERAKMLKNPPHILITTPESIALLLSSIKFKEHIKNVDWLIIDELHALAENKRGVHLSLSMERLQRLNPNICRLGLSATIAPLEELAKFLVGNDRPCKIIDVQFIKQLDLKVLSPTPNLIDTSFNTLNRETYNLLDNLIQSHKTTIIFTNTRSGTERVVHHLKTKFPKKYTKIDEKNPSKIESLIGAHHGSLSRDHRFQIEEALRNGKLKACVSSTSLELGIDIGYVDLVICLGSPKSIARLKQRCLPFYSRILLSNGTYKSIGEIVENKQNAEILSFDRKKGFVKNKIKEYHKNKSNKSIKFNLHSGLFLECTPEHQIFTKEGWKKAKNIKQGEEIAELFNLELEDNSPYIYEIINQKDFYVENRKDFVRKVVDYYVLKNKISYTEFAEKLKIKQNYLQNFMRKKGRRKSIRLDLFLKIMDISKIPEHKYINFLTELKSKSHHRLPLSLKLTKDIMWLGGMVASDGAITENKKTKELKIKIGNKDIKLLEECQKIFSNFGFYPKILKRKGKNFYSIDCGSKLLAQIFLSLGIKRGKEKSTNIEVFNLIYKLPKYLIIPYIEGILEGDGNKDNNIRIFSASKKFVIGLHNLLNKCGIQNYFTEEEAKTSKLIPKINHEISYWLHIGRMNHVKEFLKYCTLKGKKAKFLKDKKVHFFIKDKDIDKNICWTKILNIEEKENYDYVYNITLEKEPNNYFVESILTHNCGRSGHKLHDTTKGRILVLDRDDLVECSVMAKSAIEHKIDKIHIPKNCLDVLCQHIFGIALEEIIDINELYDIIKKSYCYKDLSWEDFMNAIKYLSGDFTTLEDRNVYAKIWFNDNKIGKRGKMARVIYMTNIGTIPDETNVKVKLGDNLIGTIEESFLEKLSSGDIFVLGGNTYQFKFSRGTVAQVSSAEGKKPTVPSWFSEMLPLSFDLALDIQKFRYLVDQKIKIYPKQEVVKFIKDYLYLEDMAAEAIYNYFKEQYDFLEIPHDKKIIIEHYKDEKGKKYVIFHTLYGRRVNDVLSRALAYIIGLTQHRDVEISFNDNGFFLSYEKNVNVLSALNSLKSKDLKKILDLSLEKSEVLKRRFRHCALRAMMILRQYKGYRKGVGRQQVSSMILMKAVRRISKDFIILKEAKREVMEDMMDIENSLKILDEKEKGIISIKEVNTLIPSPFAFNLILQGYSDILKMEDRVEFLRRMHKIILAKISVKK
ncbi:DEAD/DEAH box helicase [Candidatus Woesearchaeota archaeon]|nr:DEAD/DEAH box helicase [Candidatus Woesearchaeota archaeon]